MTTEPAARAVWIDGDPLMEAIAAAVWEQCARDDADMPMVVCDDPRTIAAAAAQAVRALQAVVTPTAIKPETDRNVGPGWYEVINPRNATTCIAYAYEDGSLYLPEGDALTSEDFTLAAARGNAHRLVRADEVEPAAEARQDGAQP